MSTPKRPTQFTDNNGAIIPLSTLDQISNISKFGTSNIVIVGYANHLALNSDSAWKTYFETYDASSNPVRMRFAERNNDWTHIWTTQAGVAITGASTANPCVITSVGHGLVTGDFIETDSMAAGGMVEVNSDGYGSKVYHVTRLTADTFSLQEAADPTTNINSTGFGAYTSGGKFYRHEHLNFDYS